MMQRLKTFENGRYLGMDNELGIRQMYNIK